MYEFMMIIKCSVQPAPKQWIHLEAASLPVIKIALLSV